VTNEPECTDCSTFLGELTVLKEKYASKVEELDVLRVELGEMKSRPSEGPIRRTREGGSEWEPIKILLEGDENSNKMNSLGRTPKITHSALLPSICQNHVATGVLLVLGTNTTSNLNTHAPTTAKTTRKPAVQRGRLDQVWGAVRPPPPGNQEIVRNTSSEHQNKPRFHQQRSLVRAMLATRKSWRKPKLHPGA
jgi:hypothetical protein